MKSQASTYYNDKALVMLLARLGSEYFDEPQAYWNSLRLVEESTKPDNTNKE